MFNFCASGASATARHEHVSRDARMLEALDLSLRTRRGVPVEAIDRTGLASLLEVEGDRVQLRHGGRRYDLDFETFVAYLTNRLQQLKDPAQRRLLRQIGATG